MGGLWFLFYFFIENECMFFELGIIRLGCMCVNTPSLCRSEGGEGFALPIVCRDNIYIRRGGCISHSFGGYHSLGICHDNR